MRRHGFLPLAGFWLLAAASPFAAQQAEDAPTYRRVTTPLRPVHLDLESGTYSRGPAVAAKGLAGYTTSSTLNNNDLSGFIGVDAGPGTPSGPCEWIDAANKGAGSTGGASGLLTGFSFAYCSAAQDVRSGGPGGMVRIGFRTGYLAGSSANAASPSGTDVGTFNLSGLPSNTGSSSFFGTFACYLIGVHLGSAPVVLQDGPIGWSWQYRDLGTDGALAATFPFLSCVQSCSGSGAGGTGPMVDVLDRYCPPGTLVSSFSFGTGAPGSAYFTSVSMDLREAEPIPSASASFNGNGINPVVLSPGSGPALGAAWSVRLDCTGADPTKRALLAVSLGAPLATPVPFGPGATEFLILGGPLPGLGAPQHNGAPVSFGVGSLPLDMSFYGAIFRVQGFCGDSPIGFLSNGLTQRVGF